MKLWRGRSHPGSLEGPWRQQSDLDQLKAALYKRSPRTKKKHAAPATINLLNKDITAALVEPATAKWLAEIGYGIMASSPAELDRFIVSEIDRWRAFVKEFNVRFD